MPIRPHYKTTLLSISLVLVTNSACGNTPIVEVLCHSPESPVVAGAEIPISVDIVNHLEQSIGHATYSLTPTVDNDEVHGLTVRAVYRDRMEKGSIRFVAVPTAAYRHAIPVHMIASGEKLRIELDASKWKIVDGWRPGHYKLSVRMTRLYAGPRITMTVDSSLCEFEIRTEVKAD